MKRVIAANTMAQLIGKVIGAGTSFLVAFLLARRLGAVGFGEFTKITTFVAPFFLLADFGLNAIFLQKHESERWWSGLLGLRVVGSILLMFLALAILAFIPQGTDQGYTGLVRFGIILFTPAILFQAIITTSNALFQKHLRYVWATIALAVGSLVTLLLVFPLSIGVVSATLAVLVGTAVGAGVSLYFAKRFIPLSISWSPHALRGLVVPAVPLGATLLFNLVYFRADNYILTLTRSTADVGMYGLAYKVFEVALVLPTFFMNALYPLLLKAKSENPKFISIIWKSAIILVVTSLVSLVTFWFAAPLLTYIKSDFSASISALRVLSLGLPFFFLTSLTMWSLIALKKQWLLAGIYGISMVVNISLNVWLIPVYGYMAAAWVTMASEGLVLFLSGIFVLKQLRT